MTKLQNLLVIAWWNDIRTQLAGPFHGPFILQEKSSYLRTIIRVPTELC